jgi:hypothetical protein
VSLINDFLLLINEDTVKKITALWCIHAVL